MIERRRSFYGWGFENEPLPADELKWFERAWSTLLKADGLNASAMPREEEITLRAPRFTVPKSLKAMTTTEKYERLLHSYGRSGQDLARMIHRRDFSNPPDVVAYPKTETDIVSLLDWCGANDVAVIPFGGGSSVVGGVTPPPNGGLKGSMTVDMRHFDRVLEIDKTSQAARVQCGVLGPSLEQQLKPSGLTMRFFLQAWEFSSLGGWIATRAAGHYSTVYTQIDDHIQSLRVVTPAGLVESPRVPTSGAGPSSDRMFLGSEGTLGIITEAWIRLHRRPKYRMATSVRFTDWEKAVGAVRAITQSGLYPANARLIDKEEAKYADAGDGSHHILVLTFESGDHPLDPWMERALELCGDHGGQWDNEALKDNESQRKGAAGSWRDKFVRGPHFRTHMIGCGVMRETVETAITWDRFFDLEQKVKDATRRAVRDVTGRDGTCTVRFTHVYPDGPAPYFTWHGLADKSKMVEQFWDIKVAASEAMIGAGGTITHHHAVGRDVRPWYERERPELFARSLQAAKQTLDPKKILNPGVLFDA